ncbi:MAG: homocysteine biosynthesis protein [Halothece sp. Uz-M2-17]|nr:homocysteine biosynthesis protein [Halothece sp. Uz-M2-17]
MRTIAQINDKIQAQKAVVWTVEELKAHVAEKGVSQVAKEVDVVTTGTFEPMESSGAIINLGHTDPPINIRQCWLDSVPAYTGLGAVDLYIGATASPDYSSSGETSELETRLGVSHRERGGGHVIQDLIAGQPVQLKAIGQVSDCYPRASFQTTVTRETINQFYLYNPRNVYQNFIVGVNAGERVLYTYLGPLHPNLGNAVYSSPGAIAPLFNDPQLNLIGIGTRIFLGGGIGYISAEGTQHFPKQRRLPNQTPIGPAATLTLVGDAKAMSPRWVRGCYFRNYGPSLMLGVGIPLPMLNEEAVAHCAIKDEEIVAPVVDFSIPRRVRPTFGLVSYQQLKSGTIQIEGETVRTAPLASIARSREIAELLKQQILEGIFPLAEPVAPLPMDRAFLPQDRWGSQFALE